MNPKLTDERNFVGYLGECITQLELAYEGLKTDRTAEGMLFDLVASTRARAVRRPAAVATGLIMI